MSTPDPLAALTRAYHAWIKTQPQLILDLWGDERGLDGPDSGDVVRLLEPASTPFAGSLRPRPTPSWVGQTAPTPGPHPSHPPNVRSVTWRQRRS